MYKMRERKFNNFYTKVALFALIALIGIFCGTLLFFNSFTQNNSESKKVFAATNVTTEAELVNALNNGETSITLSENITVASTINLSEVTISGSTRTLTISSTGVVNVGTNVTINVSSISVSGVLNITDATIQNDIIVTNSGICNVIGGTIDGDVIVNSSAQLNFAEPTSASISITGTINLDNGRYINVEYPITNSTNRFKVYVDANDAEEGYEVVRFDKNITNTQVVASTFQLMNNSNYALDKVQTGTGTNAYYSLKLINSVYTITITVNNSNYGTVDFSSFQVNRNSSITKSTNKITIGGTTVTATPHPNDTDGVRYSFVAWSGPDVTTVTEDLTFTANFKKEYRVRWYDGDNNLLATDYFEPGEIPNWDNNRPAPTKTSDDIYDYVWNGGWDGTAWIQPLAGPVDIRAIFENILRKYTVTWKNYDGSVALETDSNVDAGTQPSYDGAVPEEPSTDQISYTFIGWSEQANSSVGLSVGNLPPVTGNTIYYAAFSQSTAKYTVTWLNYDGSVPLETDPDVPYGSYPSYGGAQPERANENHHVYTFIGWSTSPNSTTGTTESGLPAVSGNVTYYAAFSEATETFNVTWRNYDGSLIYTDTDVPYGSRPSYDYSIPSKPFDDNTGKEYTFIGWALSPDSTTATAASDLPDVSANVTYFAIFSSTDKLYTVVWMNYDGLGEPLATYPNLTWHTVPYYHEETPTRTGEGVIYTFKGWSDVPNSGLWLDELPPVSGSNSIITYYAVFGVEAKKYTVIWKNWDGTDTLDTSENVSYGTTPTYSGATPAMEEPGVTYTFIGWATAPNSTTGITIPPVTGEETTVVYYAVFTSETKTYTVIWKNWDGSGQALETDYDVPYGSVPQFDSAEPQIDSTAEFEYTFVGWAIAPNSGEGMVLQALTGEETTVTYYAAFTKDKRKYEITFRQQNDDGVTYTTLQKFDVEYGELPVYTGVTPTKESTAQYNYTFSGWSPQLSTVTGEAVYTAQFASETQEYTIIWKNYDGTTLTSTMVPYGTVPTYAGTPEKQGDEQYEYMFDK
ncbi:MAG: InlB B-repeat-containing protein, partial [Clostridia bacterium]|nr:InlB B-repeat-containing protein [Clostridia bacterium]